MYINIFSYYTLGIMVGQQIQAVHSAIRELITFVQNIAMEHAEIESRFPVLEFGTSAKRIYPTPNYVEDF